MRNVAYGFLREFELPDRRKKLPVKELNMKEKNLLMCLMFKGGE
jgi:hypothetical protein